MNAQEFLGWLADFQTDVLLPEQSPLVMGVLNITPDSFYDGGHFLALDKACAQAFELIEQGVDIIDIGGESTKPYALLVPVEEELARIIPVIKAIRASSDICISVDTYKPLVMKMAVEAGADLINDIYALTQPGALEQAAKLKVPVCLMHMLGSPQHMQHSPSYPHGVITAVQAFLKARIDACIDAGIDRQHLIVDPGFGFGKSVTDNLSLMTHLASFKQYAQPLLLGVSRKSTIGAIIGKEANQRMIGSITLAVHAAINGVDILRVHDVAETKQALKIIQALNQTSKLPAAFKGF